MSKMYFLPFRPAFDSAGITVPGSQHWFTLAGTNTPSAPFTDVGLTIHHTNPVVSNGIGYLPPIYLDPGISYRVRVYDENAEVGVDTPLEEYDPYVPALANTDVLSDLADSTGAGLLGWIASGIGAVLRTIRDKLRESVSAEDYGADPTGTNDSLAAILAAIDAVDAAGGGVVNFGPGVFKISAQSSLGDGSNSQQSTKHHRIKLKGKGSGTGPEVSNVQAAGVTRLLYTGPSDTAKAVLSLEGPLHNVCVEDMVLDANSLAGFGININHVTQSVFRNVVTCNYRVAGRNLTTRTGFPSGCAYGNADNSFYDCYDFNPVNNTAHGISLNSGVSTGTSLAGQPSSARNRFVGGTSTYGGNAGSYGAYLSGADNNQFHGVFFLPKGGSAGGFDVYLNQWPTVGDFPKENVFFNCGMTRGVSGNGGVGPSGGNMFVPYQTGDGAAPPTLATAQTQTYDGKSYVNGVRAYRGRQIGYAGSTTPQTRSAASYADVTGYSITLTTAAATKLLIRFTARAQKATAGSGNLIINVNGTDVAETFRDLGFSTFYGSLAAETIYDVGAGSQTVKLRFQSSDTNAFTVDRGTLTVQELY